MVVVIRLQGLKITAGSEDIRNFFTGLKIPDGGVHIIGGKLGEAFIMFASDEDARRAMTRSGGCIKGSPVNLLLSSKSEMQNVLEASSRKPEVITKRIYKEFARRSAVDRGPAIFNDKLDGRRTDQDVGNRAVPGSQGDPYNPMRKAEGVNGLYLHLFGMPFSCTKENVHLFFEGLQVDDIVFLRNQRGMFNGCGMVKFATMEDAFEGLKRDRQYIGSRFIKVSTCSEQDWFRAGGSEGSENTFGYDRNPDSGYSHQKYTQDRPRSRSPLACRSRSLSPSKEELCILLENLSYSVEKGDIKDFFHPVSLKDDQIIHVLDDYGKNLRTAILILQNLKDYCACLAHHKEPFNNRILYVSPLSKEKMAAMLESRSQLAKDQRRSSPSSEKLQQRKDLEDSEKRCLYVRNLPFDVRKVEITDFFHGFHLSEDKVTLLRDETGAGLGEALLIFQTEEEATMAQTLNGQRFLGSEVMLKCISWAQVREFGVMDQIIDTPRERNSQRNASRYTKDFSHDQMSQDAGYDLSPELTIYTHGCRGQYDTPEDYHDTCRIKLDRPIQHVSGPSGQQFNGPTCLKLINLPLQITIDEIYDFCYGYRVIPGSVSLQYDRDGIPKGSATVVFESHSEAVTAVEELSGRPIGTRKIKVVFI